MPSVEQIEKLLEAEPDDAFLNYSLAMALVKEDRINEGLARFERVFEIDPNYCAAYYHQGKTYLESERYDEAREILRRGMEAAQRAGDGHAQGEMQELSESIP